MEKEKLISLVVGAQSGDSNAVNELFSGIYNDVYYFALKTVKDETTAADVTQEALIEIFNTISSLQDPAAFSAWSRKITYHQCTRYFRKKKDVLVEENEDGSNIFDLIEEDNAEFIPQEGLDKKDFRETILNFINSLSEEQSSAVFMYYFDELSVTQIAEIQGVSAGTVKSRLNYARKAIKESVEDYEKKNGIKLHAIAFLPFFKWLAISDKATVSLPSSVLQSAAKAIGTSVSAGSTAVGTAGTAAVTKTAATATAKVAGLGAKIIAAPIVAKVAAAVVVLGIVGTTTIVGLKSNNEPYRTKKSKNHSIGIQQIGPEVTKYEVIAEEVMVQSGEPEPLSNTISYKGVEYIRIYGQGTVGLRAKKIVEDITELYIPAEIDGLTVDGLDFDFSASAQNITHIEIRCKDIGVGDLNNLKNLKSVLIGKEVKHVPSFSNCENLSEVIIEPGNQNINYDFLSGTAYERNPNNWNGDIFCIDKTLIKYKNVPDDGCYTVPEGIERLAVCVFGDWCEKIIIPSTVKYGLEHAYSFTAEEVIISKDNPYYHVYNKNVIIETKAQRLVKGQAESGIPSDGSVTIIGEDAIYCNVQPNNRIPFTIPDTIEIIEDRALSNNTIIIENLPDSIKEIGEDAFRDAHFKKFKLPNKLEKLGTNAFTDTNIGGDLVIPKTLTEMGVEDQEQYLDYYSSPFYCCDFNSITVEKGNPVYKSDGNCLIKTVNASYLKHIVLVGCKNSIIPEYVTDIASFAFYKTNIKSVVLPESVCNVGSWAFRECKKLTTIEFKGLNSINGNSFDSCPQLTSITIGKNISPIYVGSFRECPKLKEVNFEDTNGWKLHGKSIDVVKKVDVIIDYLTADFDSEYHNEAANGLVRNNKY